MTDFKVALRRESSWARYGYHTESRTGRACDLRRAWANLWAERDRCFETASSLISRKNPSRCCDLGLRGFRHPGCHLNSNVVKTRFRRQVPLKEWAGESHVSPDLTACWKKGIGCSSFHYSPGHFGGTRCLPPFSNRPPRSQDLVHFLDKL